MEVTYAQKTRYNISPDKVDIKLGQSKRQVKNKNGQN